MARGDLRMALAAIKSSRWHSVLTMLGIVIGVVSVVTTVSLGEGVKQRIVGQVNRAGSDVITIRPGRTVTRDQHGHIIKISALASLTFGSLSDSDLATIKQDKTVQTMAPFAYVNGVAESDGRDYTGGPIIAVDANASGVLHQRVRYGGFFSAQDSDKNVAVLGRGVAGQLFQDNVPIGRSFTIRNQTFIVQGIFDDFSTSPLAINADYNYAIFIPYESAKHITGSQLQLYQVLVKPAPNSSLAATVSSLTNALTNAHQGQTDFTILTQAENLAVANSVLNILTTFIASIAAISLLVGGIGIMNILLLSVTERTKEIGVRKAVGATNRQILAQFLIEAMILSLTGGIVGVLGALLINYFLRVFTNLTPVISLSVILIAVGVAMIVGILFGIMPAARAARKDPIEALRHE